MEKLFKELEEAINTLKIVSSKEEEVTCNCQFITLKKGDYTLANGKTIDRETATKRIGTGSSVSIFAITEDNKIILVIQPRAVLTTPSKINIEIPAGYIEEGEDVVTCGIRELQEETGYLAQKMIHLDRYYTSVGFISEQVTLLLALNCKKVSKQKLDKDEFVIQKEVTLEEFKYLLEHHYILDVNARLGYYEYLAHQNKQ